MVTTNLQAPVQDNLPVYLTTEQVAAYLNVSAKTLNNWRCQRRVDLPYKKFGACVRYKLSDIEHFLEQHTHNKSGELYSCIDKESSHVE